MKLINFMFFDDRLKDISIYLTNLHESFEQVMDLYSEIYLAIDAIGTLSEEEFIPSIEIDLNKFTVSLPCTY